MKTYFMLWAFGLALVQAALAGEAGTAVVEQRAQSFTIILNGSVSDVTPLFGPVREAEGARQCPSRSRESPGDRAVSANPLAPGCGRC